MTDRICPEDRPDPALLALCREHVKSPKGYVPPPEVTTASQGMKDLLARTEGRTMSRDEKRLAARYGKAKDAHWDDLVAEHVPEAAPHSENGA